jgi:N-acetyl-anhydromuramyl-L-alanine amidase AmpD
MRSLTSMYLCITLSILSSCTKTTAPETHSLSDQKPGTLLPRAGDEIVVCGQLFHTGAPVVLWLDPGGYDAYRTDRRFAAYDKSSFEATTRESSGIKSPERYNMRYTAPVTQPTTRALVTGKNFLLSDEELAKARAGWELDDLRKRVDQFVYHYDVAGTSQVCFKVLHDNRGLSVHFMLDLDGTIYQTLDLKERAWHATTSNTRSVGIEIANMGAYPSRTANAFQEWYQKDENGQTRIVLPKRYGDGGLRNKSIVLRPARNEVIAGQVQGRTYHMYDLTPQQYDSLIKLTATLCTIFPEMKCDYPRDNDGKLITRTLPDEMLANYKGLIGHYHIQKEKQDPGPAFDWDRVINGARRLMR